MTAALQLPTVREVVSATAINPNAGLDDETIEEMLRVTLRAPDEEEIA